MTVIERGGNWICDCRTAMEEPIKWNQELLFEFGVWEVQLLQ